MRFQERVRLWLAERRTDGDGDAVRLVYTTPDGGHVHHKEVRGDGEGARAPTATIEVDPAKLASIDDADERVVLATSARETRKRYGPDEPI